MKHLLTLAALVFATACFGQEACPPPQDSDGNGFIGSADLIDLLANFGDSDTDGDGIWDSEDDCVGAYDECGVCNGVGPTVPIIVGIQILYDSVFAEAIEEWLVFEVGADTSFQFVCDYPEGCTDSQASNFDLNAVIDDGSCWYCGETVEYQGYDYSTVQIGEQCWFAENLRSENYENGDVIPANLNDSEWFSTALGATAVYGEGDIYCFNYSPDGDACDEVWSLSEFGRLYNWYAVDDIRGICPSGWHVPTLVEWTIMTDFLGGATNAGLQMKTTYGWANGNNGTNSSGFSGLPGGYRGPPSEVFGNVGFNGFWWSSSSDGSLPSLVYLASSSETAYQSTHNPRSGRSIRCIKDSE